MIFKAPIKSPHKGEPVSPRGPRVQKEKHAIRIADLLDRRSALGSFEVVGRGPRLLRFELKRREPWRSTTEQYSDDSRVGDAPCVEPFIGASTRERPLGRIDVQFPPAAGRRKPIGVRTPPTQGGPAKGARMSRTRKERERRVLDVLAKAHLEAPDGGGWMPLHLILKEQELSPSGRRMYIGTVQLILVRLVNKGLLEVKKVDVTAESPGTRVYQITKRGLIERSNPVRSRRSLFSRWRRRPSDG